MMSTENPTPSFNESQEVMERAAYEAHVLQQNAFEILDRKNGIYTMPAVQKGWGVWQAAKRHSNLSSQGCIPLDLIDLEVMRDLLQSGYDACFVEISQNANKDPEASIKGMLARFRQRFGAQEAVASVSALPVASGSSKGKEYDRWPLKQALRKCFTETKPAFRASCDIMFDNLNRATDAFLAKQLGVVALSRTVYDSWPLKSALHQAVSKTQEKHRRSADIMFTNLDAAVDAFFTEKEVDRLFSWVDDSLRRR